MTTAAPLELLLCCASLQVVLQFTLASRALVSTSALVMKLQQAQGGLAMQSQPSVQRLSSE